MLMVKIPVLWQSHQCLQSQRSSPSSSSSSSSILCPMSLMHFSAKVLLIAFAASSPTKGDRYGRMALSHDVRSNCLLLIRSQTFFTIHFTEQSINSDTSMQGMARKCSLCHFQNPTSNAPKEENSMRKKFNFRYPNNMTTGILFGGGGGSGQGRLTICKLFNFKNQFSNLSNALC